jgi:hypothetical protein
VHDGDEARKFAIEEKIEHRGRKKPSYAASPQERQTLFVGNGRLIQFPVKGGIRVNPLPYLLKRHGQGVRSPAKDGIRMNP